jgi:hypothetical protein
MVQCGFCSAIRSHHDDGLVARFRTETDIELLSGTWDLRTIFSAREWQGRAQREVATSKSIREGESWTARCILWLLSKREVSQTCFRRLDVDQRLIPLSVQSLGKARPGHRGVTACRERVPKGVATAGGRQVDVGCGERCRPGVRTGLKQTDEPFAGLCRSGTRPLYLLSR